MTHPPYDSFNNVLRREYEHFHEMVFFWCIQHTHTSTVELETKISK